MASDNDEYYEMNFCKLKAVPFGVATINQRLLPWQLIVSESFSDINEPDRRQNFIKCWDSNELFELDLEYLSDEYIAIVSLSTGLFRKGYKAFSALFLLTSGLNRK